MSSNTQNPYVVGCMAATPGIRQVIINAKATKDRVLAHAGTLLQDPGKCRVGHRLAQEAMESWYQVVRQVISQDWGRLAGNKYTR